MPPGKTNQLYLDGLHAAARACTGEENPDMWEYRGARHLAGKCDPRRCKVRKKAALAAKPGPVRKFAVYFDQVNQARYEVRAASERAAVEKAARLWKQDHGSPVGAYVEGRPDENGG